jgi:O-antigen ligase
VPALLWRQWRDPAAWSTTSDVFVILIAVSLPWSTTLVAIFATALRVSMGPFLDAKGFLQSLQRPISALPVALAAVGMLWSNVPWGATLRRRPVRETPDAAGTALSLRALRAACRR